MFALCPPLGIVCRLCVYLCKVAAEATDGFGSKNSVKLYF